MRYNNNIGRYATKFIERKKRVDNAVIDSINYHFRDDETKPFIRK